VKNSPVKKNAAQNNARQKIPLSLTTGVLKAAGDELRTQILRILQRDAFGVLELSRIFGLRQPAMSHHLKILSQSGLVAFRREGTCVFYRRSFYEQDGLDLLRQQIFAQLDRCPIADEIEAGIAAIHRERAESSQAFFRNNAGRFRKQQDLIAGYNQYGDSILELIDELHLASNKTALEIGPGEGDLLPELAARFDRVIALDSSAEMLDRSKSVVEQKNISNIEFVLGDASSLDEPIQADIITLNMVLHHLAQPANTLKVIHALLNEAGVLIVTELCQHDQDWAHTACGDLWLGFCPEELCMWANAAGFDEGQSLFLSQRNGFRIQLRQFLKPIAK
jgi:ubiquinone/menaquinone biosynthesis C-methylase UbiE